VKILVLILLWILLWIWILLRVLILHAGGSGRWKRMRTNQSRIRI
jgi:hypothetical protein